MSVERIVTDRAPRALGPYSQGVAAGPWVFVSGQLGIDPATGSLAPGGTAAQARQAMRNIAAILEARGAALKDVVRMTLYLRDLADFAVVNAVLEECFRSAPPARATIQAARLPLDAEVEIEVQAWSG